MKCCKKCIFYQRENSKDKVEAEVKKWIKEL